MLDVIDKRWVREKCAYRRDGDGTADEYPP